MLNQKKEQTDKNLKSRLRDAAESKLASLSPPKAPKIKTKEI